MINLCQWSHRTASWATAAVTLTTKPSLALSIFVRPTVLLSWLVVAVKWHSLIVSHTQQVNEFISHHVKVNLLKAPFHKALICWLPMKCKFSDCGIFVTVYCVPSGAQHKQRKMHTFRLQWKLSFFLSSPALHWLCQLLSFLETSWNMAASCNDDVAPLALILQCTTNLWPV